MPVATDPEIERSTRMKARIVEIVDGIGGPGEAPSTTWASSETISGSETINLRRRRRHAIEGVLLDAGLNFDDDQHEALCSAFLLALEAL